MAKNIRRVVTGLTADGRSTVLFDGPAENNVSQPDWPSSRVSMLWASDSAPASNAGSDDAAAGPFQMMPAPSGTTCIHVQYAPISELAGLSDAEKAEIMKPPFPPRDLRPDLHPGMHRTASLDYIVMLSGEVTLILETGEVTLHAGDVVVDRGVFHAWENRGSETAHAVGIIIDATHLQPQG